MKLLLTVILLSVNLLAVVSGNERQLQCQGKTLNEWIEELHHKDVGVRRSAARALEDKGSEAKEAIPALIEVLIDKDEYVRAAAGRALGKMGPEAVAALVKALQSTQFYTRRMAARTLGGIGPRAKEAIPALAEALQSQNEDEGVKSEAAEALGKMGPEAVPALAKSLQNTQYYTRRMAARALGETGGAGAVPALIKALQDKDSSLRVISVWSLGRIGSDAKEAIPALTRALEDERYNVRTSATRSLWLIRTGSEQDQKTSVFPHGEAKDGLAAFLLCHKRRFQVGEPIPLSYGVIFVGPGLEQRSDGVYDLKIKVWRPSGPVDPHNASWFVVTGPDGKNVPYHGIYVTRPVRKPSDKNTALLRYREFIGRPHSDLCEVGAFHLNKPGTYKVQWSYEPFSAGGDGLWDGKLVSNELQIEIVK